MKSPRFFSGLAGLWRCLASLLIWLMPAGPAAAHPMLQNAMWIEIGPSKIAVRLEVSVRELCVVQGLPITVDGTVDEGLAEDTAPRHSAYVLEHLELRGDGRLLSGKVAGIDPPAQVKQGGEGSDKSYFIYRLEYALPTPSPAGFSLVQTMVKEFPSAPGVPWDLSYAYRCGTPSQPMKNYGVLPRDSRISFLADGSMAVEDTGRAGPDGSPLPPAQAGLMAFWAALGLNAASRRDAGRVALFAAGAFVSGCVLSACFAGFQGPGWLLAGMAGVGILLASVDNIHRPGAPADGRRLLLAVIFSLAAGHSAGHLARVAHAANPSVPGTLALAAMPFALPAVVLFVLSAVVILRLQKSLAPGPLRALRQLLSLGCALIGLLVLFHGLGIKPWDYWLTKFSGRGV